MSHLSKQNKSLTHNIKPFINYSNLNKMKTIKFLLLMLVGVTMTSCWTYHSVTVTDIPEQYLGNKYDALVGMSKSQVLAEMSVPDRTMDDGLGGEVLIYEKKEQVSKTTGYSAASATTKPVTNYWTGQTSLQSSGYNSMNSSTVTQENKEYVNVFINADNICYKIDANIGDIYEPAVTHQECYKEPNPILLAISIPYSLVLVGLPHAIWYGVQKAKIKKEGRIVVDCENRK